MIKKILGLLIIVIAMTSAIGCSEAEDIESINKQTVFVYMPWTGAGSNLYNYFTTNLDSIYSAIKKKGGLGTSRLVVFLSESASRSSLFEVTYDGSNIQKQTLKEYSGNSYISTEGLTQLLNDVKGYAYGLNYAMIIGSHGVGWTFKEDWTDYPYRAKPFDGSIFEERIPYQNYRYGEMTDAQTRFFGSLSDMNNYSMNVPTLADAIKAADMKMQYIYFDDCYMANVEVAYELREVTNFLVASTSEMLAAGTPFASSWTYLASLTPNYSSMVSTFVDFYNKTDYPYATLSAIDCRCMDQLALMMADINNQYKFDATKLEKLQRLDGFAQPIFYDMKSYLEHLCPNTNDYKQFLTVLDKAVPYKNHTEKYYSYIYNEPMTFNIETFSGITISDPSQNNVAMKGKEKTSWWKATH